MTAVVALAAFVGFSGCLVQGGEEAGRHNRPLPATRGISRFEAQNQDGEVVGSGCTLDWDGFREGVRFSAKAGDQVVLRQLFSRVAADVEKPSEAQMNDPEYWCGVGSKPYRYAGVLDGECAQAVEPELSESCRNEAGLAARIDAFEYIPNVALPKAAEVDGYAMSLHVLGKGRQCVQLRCSRTEPSLELMLFVVQ